MKHENNRGKTRKLQQPSRLHVMQRVMQLMQENPAKPFGKRYLKCLGNMPA
jgi:hypothetical protein